jgi:hypothetical protein
MPVYSNGMGKGNSEYTNKVVGMWSEQCEIVEANQNLQRPVLE